jgi:hypothetical protein
MFDASQATRFIPRAQYRRHLLMKILSQVFISTLAAFILGGCASDPRFDEDTVYLADAHGGSSQRFQEPERAPFDNVSYWDGDGVAGPPRVVIRLGEQRAYFYKGDELVGVSVVSTGREGYDTVTGDFKIKEKDIDHRSNLYGDFVDASTGQVLVKDVDARKDRKPPGTRFLGAPMPYFMRIVGGTGMHEGFLPGYAASHGCIRMPGFMAETFYANVSVGTPVTITR